MISRVMKARDLPAHSMTIDKLAEICRVLIQRFGNEEETKCLIVLITKNGALGFESVEELVRNKSKIRDSIQKYAIELEGYQSKNGLQTVKILPAYSKDNSQLKASITAFSGNEGWCADIIATALTEFSRYKLRLNWAYSDFVVLPIIFVAGIMMGALATGTEKLNAQEIGIMVLCAISACCIGLIIYSRALRGKTAEIRMTEEIGIDWIPILIIMLAVLEIILGCLTVYLQLGGN